jgi:tryptophan synthase alpha subunit
MSRIHEAFRRCREEGEGALICYLTAGYPDERAFKQHFQACLEGGADIMEIGVPFSDPVADGPTIQRTSQIALAKGMTPARVFDSVRALRQGSAIPIVLMGYYNPIFRWGERSYVRSSAQAGVDGLIVADLPLEESSGLRSTCHQEGVDLIQLASPLSRGVRLQQICDASQGYLYLVSALGTTGARNSLAKGLPQLIERTKRVAGELPVAVGFGISGPKHVGQVVQAGADGAIVGSALLAQIIEGASPERIAGFVAELKAATKRG